MPVLHPLWTPMAVSYTFIKLFTVVVTQKTGNATNNYIFCFENKFNVLCLF